MRPFHTSTKDPRPICSSKRMSFRGISQLIFNREYSAGWKTITLQQEIFISSVYLSSSLSLSLTFTFFCCPAHESRDRKKKQETYQSSFFRHVITELSKPLAIVNVKHHKLKCLRNCNSPENAHWVGDLHLKVPLPGRPVFHHVLVLTSLGSFSHASVQN